MAIKNESVEEVKQRAQLLEIVQTVIPLKKAGKDYKGDCPFCQSKDKFTVSPVKDIFKCWACDQAGKGAIAFLMDHNKLDFKDAIRWLADHYKMVISESKSLKSGPSVGKIQAQRGAKPFRDIQLKASGLSDPDQKSMLVNDDKKQTEINRYIAGTVNEHFEIIHGDDMIMRYLDLNGKPVTYTVQGKKERELIRIRWKNPDLHLSKENKPKKYDQPYGSKSALWINQWVARKYQSKTEIETLFIQEGEKKADKATKEGMISVGIMGIHNLAVHNELPHEFELIIEKCKVKNIVFVLDSDWLDLGNGRGSVNTRSKTFLSAVKKFHDYFYAFNNIGIHLNIYFAAIKNRGKDEKGIDDVLAGSLKGSEDKMSKDFEKAMRSPSGDGEFVQVFKITGKTEYQLKEYFHLHTPQAFMEFHKEKLKQRGTFMYNNYEWRWDEDEKTFQLSQPLMPDEKFWNETVFYTKDNKEVKKLQLLYDKLYTFLKNKKFFRYAMPGGKFKWIQIDSLKVIHEMEPFMIKDYVVEFIKEIGEIDALNMLYRGAKMYLGPDSLSNIDFVKPKFHKSDKGVQYLYFKNNYWKITKDKIEQNTLKDLDGFVWDKKVIDFEASIPEEPFLFVTQDEAGDFDIMLGEDAQQCDFLTFLFNTSNFYNKKKSELSEVEMNETVKHLLNKLSAIGYLLHQYRDSNVLKAVICQDGKISAVGTSNGRSGKSILGDALEKVIPTTYIPGKRKDLTEDRFIWEEVDERTQLILIDDVRVNIDFEFFFPIISGKMQIEVKGMKKFTLPRENTPKLMITTNHALNGEGSSFNDRQVLLAFSDHYNDKHRPVDDFGKLFFDEWDYNQWNRFYNLMAACTQIYFQFGIISANVERLEKRRLRQQVGEDLMEWAGLYFDKSISDGATSMSPALGTKIAKNLMYDDFTTNYPHVKKYISIRDFKKRMMLYCKYMGYVLNPGKPKDNQEWGGDDKVAGVEYFTVIDTKEITP